MFFSYCLKFMVKSLHHVVLVIVQEGVYFSHMLQRYILILTLPNVWARKKSQTCNIWLFFFLLFMLRQ